MSRYIAYTAEMCFLLLIGLLCGWSAAKADIPLLQVNTDTETGCEYMVNRNGGVTPRIGADYMHSGCKGYEGQE